LVDDGKSTLVGRLLHDSKAILADQLDAVARTSADRGFGGEKGGIDLALLTDGLRAEREQGITIDVAYRYFATDRRSFILADCPGHVQYTKNTVTGASTADAVVVLIDARKGVLEQTRRHLSVLQLLRVAHVIVAVNKIDLVDFSEDVFRGIEADVQKVGRELGLGRDDSNTGGIADLFVIPVSALDGVPGLGESKRKALLAQFGSVKSIRTASVEELTGAKGIGPSLAAAIVRHFTDDDGDAATVPAINMTTGEILET